MVPHLLWESIIEQSYCLVERTQPSIKDLSSLHGVLWSGRRPAENSNRVSLDLGTQKDVSLKTSEKKGQINRLYYKRTHYSAWMTDPPVTWVSKGLHEIWVTAMTHRVGWTL